MKSTTLPAWGQGAPVLDALLTRDRSRAHGHVDDLSELTTPPGSVAHAALLDLPGKPPGARGPAGRGASTPSDARGNRLLSAPGGMVSDTPPCERSKLLDELAELARGTHPLANGRPVDVGSLLDTIDEIEGTVGAAR